MNVKVQTFLVLGISKSGYFATKFLLENNVKCYIFEDFKSPKVDSAIEELISLGATRVTCKNIDDILSKIDVLIISPGVKINHEIAVKAKKNGIRIISELEFAFLSILPEIIAVTGTNGKTTTVNLINEIYRKANYKSILCGNVGVPVSQILSEVNRDTVCIAEVSSFQLESTNTFCPHISCVLNIAPDHLERHFSMENYIFLKKRIFKNQRESEYTVLNYDDLTVRNFYSETKGKILWVSIREKVDGAYALDKKIYYKGDFIMDLDKLAIKGEHNLQNALFAIAVAKIDKISNEVICDALSNFKGIEHRIEFIDKINGVSFYNDSKATNTASCISALNSVKGPIILILGGKDKGEVYDDLMEKIKLHSIKHVVIYGEARHKIANSAVSHGINDVTITSKFKNALRISAILCEDGDSVLLSPACSSLDEFNSFEERGRAFCSFVESLK